MSSSWVQGNLEWHAATNPQHRKLVHYMEDQIWSFLELMASFRYVKVLSRMFHYVDLRWFIPLGDCANTHTRAPMQPVVAGPEVRILRLRRFVGIVLQIIRHRCLQEGQGMSTALLMTW
ncbi:unnamed protein product [Urochloa humidicola]